MGVLSLVSSGGCVARQVGFRCRSGSWRSLLLTVVDAHAEMNVAVGAVSEQRVLVRVWVASLDPNAADLAL